MHVYAMCKCIFSVTASDKACYLNEKHLWVFNTDFIIWSNSFVVTSICFIGIVLLKAIYNTSAHNLIYQNMCVYYKQTPY